jgi:hypothetical protein
MTHHVMNQMGHQFPNMIGVQAAELDAKVMPLLPGYMTMGQSGMGEMNMAIPPNSVAMAGGQGRYGNITMGGMFTVLKVRDQLTTYADPGWYENPPATLATLATAAELLRDGIDPAKPPPASPSR